MARKLFVVGCWKSLTSGEALKISVDSINEANVKTDLVDVVVSPPFASLLLAKSLLNKGFEVGAQSCWVGGQFTDEPSISMLSHHKIPWVILGHYERRKSNETNESIKEKIAHALSKNMKVIVCVGETLEEHDAGSTKAVIAEQTQAIKDGVGQDSRWKDVVIAYEPVWAFGTGEIVRPADAQSVHSDLRNWLKEKVNPEVAANTRIIYGGPINGEECSKMVEEKDVDGVLVWGDSEVEFVGILNSLRIPQD